MINDSFKCHKEMCVISELRIIPVEWKWILYIQFNIIVQRTVDGCATIRVVKYINITEHLSSNVQLRHIGV